LQAFQLVGTQIDAEKADEIHYREGAKVAKESRKNPYRSWDADFHGKIGWNIRIQNNCTLVSRKAAKRAKKDGARVLNPNALCVLLSDIKI
jgi:hypothetical protein